MSLTLNTDSPEAAALEWYRGFGSDRYAFGRACSGRLVKIVHLGFKTSYPLVITQLCDETGMPERTISHHGYVNDAIDTHKVVPA